MSALANRARGEARLMIAGRARRLCLTLGALAALEAAFEVRTLEALGARLRRLTARDLLIVLAALLDDDALTPAALARLDIEPLSAARAVAAAIAGAFADD